MSDRSNNQGRAYEYICLKTIWEEIVRHRNAVIESNSAYHAALHAWDSIDPLLQPILQRSAEAIVTTLFDMEPMILEQSDDVLVLKIQTDHEGESGDVRDILLSRKDVCWEIGLSIKHNHFAVKHSRLAKTLDFGMQWYGIPCSSEYWQSVTPLFQRLEHEKQLGHTWRNLPNKSVDVYIPLLSAFMAEVKRSNALDPDVPKKMVEYLLGEFDFYKIISLDSKRMTQIQSYNLHGKLNRPTKTVKPKIPIPLALLPTRIVSLDFKPNSKTTVELYMDGGWQFSFRIHNADKIIVPSLKFDVRIIGMPTAILTINCQWR